MNDKLPNVVIYCDGACEPNPGHGGWAAILICGDRTKEIVGTCDRTSNQRMELTAAIKGLQALTVRCDVEIISDSQYLVKGVTQWFPRWKSEGLEHCGKKNIDLFQELDRLSTRHAIRWTWIKGHSGNPMNERCDELAENAARKISTEDVCR